MISIEYELDDFYSAKAILEDERLAYTAQNDPNLVDLGKYKLLLARLEDIEFEDKLSRIVCGDTYKFPYYKGWELTKLFTAIGLTQYVHDGSTRAIWVSKVLKKMNINEITELVKEIFKIKYFEKWSQQINQDQHLLIESALKEFQKFIDSCMLSNKSIDLALITNTSLTSEMLFEPVLSSQDQTLQDLIFDAKTRFFNLNDKQIALEKLWDAFERLKTYFDGNKKISAERIINLCSFDNRLLDDEFKVLTEIGNTYQIRHHETNRIPLTSYEHLDYLFYRMLSLINLCMKVISKYESYKNNKREFADI